MRSFNRFSHFAVALGLAALTGLTTPALAGESAGQYMDDTAISAKIKASLIKDQELKAFEIHVETEQGIVHLTGTVDTSLQKANAVRIAKTTENVKDVVNDIMVGKK